MAEILKVLGQGNPVVNELATLYSVPEGGFCTISSLVVCNRSSDLAHFRISVAISNSPDSPEQYLYYDHEIFGNTTFVATIGITLSHTDTIRIYSSGNLSFHVYGIEVN